MFPSQEASLITLRNLGWRPTVCIDIGAYQGEWASMFGGIFPDAKVLMIEAQKAKEPFLEQTTRLFPGYRYAVALLGASDGSEVEFVEMETGSSVFEESSHFARSRFRRALVTLDSLTENYPPFMNANMIKLDTQGYELEVLRGATRVLASVDVVLLEVSLIPINKGAPSFAAVVEFMTACGFRLFDFCSQIRRKDGVLWQTDLLFLRKGAIPNLVERLTPENW